MADTDITPAGNDDPSVPTTGIPSPAAVAQRIRRRTRHFRKDDLRYSTLSKGAK